MPEILTESFCERCGTRYTFESAAPRAARLKGLKVVSRGLKNFVLSDDSSLDEAMAAARSDTDREVTAQQLDAFHKTFNFCMSCRQYTCANCWNESEGRCLSCAPHLGHEVLPTPFPDLGPAVVGLEANGNGNGVEEHGPNGHAAGAAMLAWPTSDLMREEEEAVAAEAGDDIPEVDAVARLAALDGVVTDAPEVVADEAAQADTTPEAVDADDTTDPTDVNATAPVVDEVGAASAVDEVVPTVVEDIPEEPAIAATAIPDETTAPDPIPPDIESTAAAAAAQTTDLLGRFRPGQSLDEAIEAFERDRIAAEDAAKVAALAAAPDAAEAPDGDAGSTADAAAALAAGAALASRPNDDIEQPTWQIVAPEAAVTPQVPLPAPVAPAPPTSTPPAPTSEPQWPTTPEWPSHQAAAGPLMNRPAASSLDTLWAESAREVATVAAVPGAAAAAKTGVQPCVSCGLSLSATARFCRRCGTRQG